MTLGSRRGGELEGLAGRTSNRVEGGAWVLAGHGSSLFERPRDQVESHPPGCIWWQRREPRREARRHRHCLELPPVSSVTGDQESELQSRCPSEASNRRKRTNRACTGDATKERRCFGHERGAPRGACDGFVTWIPTETDRPARPTMGNHRGTADDAPSRVASRSADRRRRGRSFFAPAHHLGTSGSERFIGTAKARG
jgi:hypothetical protein